MAALLNTDIKSTTLEGGVLELVQLLQVAEQNFVPPTGTPQPNKVQLIVNTDARTATISATLPLTLTVGTDGSLKTIATEYC